MKKIFLLILINILISCNVKESTEYKKLQTENIKLKKENDSLKNTSENRYLQAYNEYKTENYSEAIKLFETFIENYSESYYYVKAKMNLKSAKYKLKKINSEIALKKKLKFKALKETPSFKLDSVYIKAFGFNFTENFRFDRYDDRYFYRQAERGTKFLSFDVNITAENKNPQLPVFYIYVYEKGKLNLISQSKGMEYKFYRWEDYGSYLGNDADFGNDFRRTKTIKFDVGEQISIEKYKGKEVYLVASKINKAQKTAVNYGNPEIAYINSRNNYTTIIDDLDEFEKEFIFVKKL